VYVIINIETILKGVVIYMKNNNRLITLEQLLKDKPEINDLFYQIMTETTEVKRRILLTAMIMTLIEHIEDKDAEESVFWIRLNG
jgi:negative regulator of genetic competence, sporulation and motility